MKVVWKVLATGVAFLAAIAIASAGFEFLFGHSYPAFVTMTALLIVAPVAFLIWRER